MKTILLALAFLMMTVVGCTKSEHNHDHNEMMKTDTASHHIDMKMDTTQVAAVYTCPMHSDVKSDKPGSCPKCGMDLVKK